MHKILHSKKLLYLHTCVARSEPYGLAFTNLVVHFPLSSVVRMCLSYEFLDFCSSKRVFAHHWAGVTGGVGLLHGVVIYNLIGAVSTSSRRGGYISSCVKKKKKKRISLIFSLISIYSNVCWLHEETSLLSGDIRNSSPKNKKFCILYGLTFLYTLPC